MGELPSTTLAPVEIPLATRQQILDLFPNLQTHPHRLGYCRLLQYLLFSNFKDRIEPLEHDRLWDLPNPDALGEAVARGEIVVPFERVAQCMGVHPKSHGFSALRVLDDFAAHVIPLTIRPHDRDSGRARVAYPAIPGALRRILEDMARQSGTPEAARRLTSVVWFDTGQRVTRANSKHRWGQYTRHLEEREGEVKPGSPAHRIVEHARRYRNKIGREIRDRLLVTLPLIEDLPEGSTRTHCLTLLHNLQAFPYMYYATTPNTVRLHAQGNNAHQFPRHIRKKLFEGLIEADLRAAQLAIVAKIWDVPPLHEFLKDGHNIWAELGDHLGLPSGRYKPLLKSSVYSLVFGMTKTKLAANLHAGLEQGTEAEKQACAQRFLRHRLIAPLLKARSRQCKQVSRDRGGRDAFGDWLELEPVYTVRQVDASTCQFHDESYRSAPRRTVRSVLAAIVQSYELRLMEPVIDIVESTQQVYMLSWLHDGVTLLPGNRTKASRLCRQLESGVGRRAAELDIATRLEVTFDL